MCDVSVCQSCFKLARQWKWEDRRRNSTTRRWCHRSSSADNNIIMMHHQNLRLISSLLIGLLAILSRKGHIVQSFTAPIIRGTVIAKPTIHANTNNSKNIRAPLPLFKSLPIIYSPRILTPCTTTVAVVLQAEPTNIGDSDSSSSNDANEIIARRIIVVGDVDGGYYRSCVKNEVR